MIEHHEPPLGPSTPGLLSLLDLRLWNATTSVLTPSSPFVRNMPKYSYKALPVRSGSAAAFIGSDISTAGVLDALSLLEPTRTLKVNNLRECIDYCPAGGSGSSTLLGSSSSEATETCPKSPDPASGSNYEFFGQRPSRKGVML